MNEEREKRISDLLSSFEDICRARGLRVTHQRSEIFRELAVSPDHPTAENVFSRLRPRLKTISLDTVYRTFATFEESGLIKRVQMVGDAARFDVNLTVHHHMICTDCDRIEDFYWPAFDAMTLPEPTDNWAKIESRHVELRGLCRICTAKSPK